MIEVESEKREIKIKGKGILYYADENIYGIQVDDYNKMFEIKELCEEIHFNLRKLKLLLGE